MKSKLLFSLALFSMGVMNAYVQKTAVSVTMDYSGKPSWFYQNASGALQELSKENVLKRGLRSAKQVRAYEKYVRNHPGSFCNQHVYSAFKPRPVAVTAASTSKVAPILAHPTTQFTALAAGTLVVGTAVAGATVYGAQKAYGYMYPKQEVKLTRFESAKLALHNGYTTVKTNAIDGYKSSLKFVKANPMPTAGAVAAVAALGLVAYKYSDSIFGKSKAEAAPEAPKAPVRVAHVRALRD